MKLVKILAISFCVILILTQNVFALSNIFSIGEDWEQTGKDHTSTTMNTESLSDISSQLYNLLLAIATGVAVVIGAILGIQYMTAGINKKVEVKESLFPYLVSCIVVFGSLGIWKLVVTIMKNF